MKIINEAGIKEIQAFLAANHKKGDSLDRDNLLAWANEAADHLADGNGAYIEVRSHESVTGNPIIFEVSDKGIESDEECCERLGFWAKMISGQGWVTCNATDPGATHDVNRLRLFLANGDA